MISRIELQNFRGFKDFKTTLTPITVLGGRNNAGKTSILEALLFLYSHSDPNCFFQMNFFRHMNDQALYTPERLWAPLFYGFNLDRGMSILLEDSVFGNKVLRIYKGNEQSQSVDLNLNALRNNFLHNGAVMQKYTLKFSYKSRNVDEAGYYSIETTPPVPVLPNYNPVNITYTHKKIAPNTPLTAVFFFKSETFMNHNNLAQWFGQLILNDKKAVVLKAFKLFDNNIVDVQTIVKGMSGYIYAIYSDGRKMPVSYMGDGMNRMVNILLSILANPSSLILIDEVENGFHYSMYQKFWELIGSVAIENNCQIIANTHSSDLLRGAVNGLKSVKLLDKLSYIRLDKKDDIIAHVFDSELIDYALDSEMEVR